MTRHSHVRGSWCRGIPVLLATVLLAAPASTFALDKCVGADGKVTYSDHGCVTGAKRSGLEGGGSLADAQIEYYDVSAPGGYTANTTWHLSYEYRPRSQPGGACEVDTVTTKLDLKVSMPRWAPTAGASPDLSARWSRYISALQVHEAGHLQTGRDFESGFKRAALAARAANCGELNSALRTLFDSLLDQARARDRDYDARTGHGATQGAVFK